MTHTIAVKPIRTEHDYDETISRIDALLDKNLPPGTPEDDELDVLSTLVEAYENQHYPTPSLDPIDAIRAAMEERGMIQQDLIPIIGPKSRVSEIMNRKRKPTIKEIHALHQRLNIPLSLFFTKHDYTAGAKASQ